MADTTVKIYAFVNDTSLYSRDYTVPGGTSSIDQGAGCMIDKVSQMFGTLGYIRDKRTTRVPMPYLCDTTSMEASDLKTKLDSSNVFLDGGMTLVYDAAKVTSEVQATFADDTLMGKVFDCIEVMGNYQIFNNDLSRTGVDASAALASYKKYGGSTVTVDLDQTPQCEYVVKDGVKKLIGVNHEQDIDGVKTSFTTNRYVRTSAVLTYEATLADGTTVDIELHMWYGEDAFVSEYPLCTITNAVFPCPPEYLYELLDNYKTVSLFATASSQYQSEAYNKITASNDHTGVYTFTTDYYAYPDTQPTNTFKLSFGCVYKGAKPTLEEVKTYLRAQVLGIIPAHTEEEWRKKLPGLIADRQFFLIPVYDNVFSTTADGSNLTCRWGIMDNTVLSAIVRKVLGSSYSAVTDYVQTIMPNYSDYPVISVPHIENPSTSRLISTLYPDYVGAKVTDTYESHPISEIECANTLDFNSHFDDELANAASNIESKLVTLTDYPDLYWTTFTPVDGTTYYILAKKSYPTVR